jgi:hypothetical protein
MANSTLAAIQVKVRRITRSPSEQQLTTDQINEYINTFIQYDFPEHLRLFNLRDTVTIWTQPFIESLSTVDAPPDSPLFNFKNRYLTVHNPVYVNGYQVKLSLSRNEFYSYWPQNRSGQQIGQGDSATFTYSGVLNAVPVLRNNVAFVSITDTNVGIRVSDDGLGGFVGDVGIGPNTIDYVTGSFQITFSLAPGSGQPINAETFPYQPARPVVMLFFHDTFTFRPVPDQVYPVQMEVYYRPTELLASNQSPELEEWWQYIAFSAAKKILEDRSDYDSVNQIMPALKEQERLCLRRTIVQQTEERTATIYVNSLSGGGGQNWGQSGF